MTKHRVRLHMKKFGGSNILTVVLETKSSNGKSSFLKDYTLTVYRPGVFYNQMRDEKIYESFHNIFSDGCSFYDR